MADSIAALESTLTIGIIVAVVNSGENYDQDAEPLLLADGLPEHQAVDRHFVDVAQPARQPDVADPGSIVERCHGGERGLEVGIEGRVVDRVL